MRFLSSAFLDQQFIFLYIRDTKLHIMAFIDYYQTLGISKSATAADIKKAYRKLARKYHPDLNPNDTEAHKKFQQINEANEVLTNGDSRKKYDNYGQNWQQADQYASANRGRQAQQSQGYTYNDYGGGDADGDFSDFFQSMFGGRRSQAAYKGQDLRGEIQLNLREIVEDQKKTITLNGKNIRITVPAGVVNGQVIKLSGYGNPGANNGPSGDLYITFVVPEDSEFLRVEENLYKQVDIDLITAVLGGDLTVKTLDGEVRLKVAAGTQNNTKVKLKGKGLPKYKKDSTGALFITYVVKIPTNLTDQQKTLFQQLADLN